MSVELQDTLANIVQQLASFFSTSVEYIKENIPTFLEQYGWFKCIIDIRTWSIVWLIIVIAFFLIYFLVLIDSWYINSSEIKKEIKIAVLILVAMFVFVGFIIALPCLVNPTLYAVSKLVNS